MNPLNLVNLIDECQSFRSTTVCVAALSKIAQSQTGDQQSKSKKAVSAVLITKPDAHDALWRVAKK